ncbi:MAG: TraR/DksA family transcriptional regulator [Parasphingorhabdus sp.]
MSEGNGNWTEVRAELEARHIELTDRLGRVEEELHSSHSQDFADQATEREQDEVLEGEELVFEQEIAQIEAAIARIDGGTYGDCQKCGDAIAAARLNVQPEAPLCINCAS